jgi:hypothetical protein
MSPAIRLDLVAQGQKFVNARDRQPKEDTATAKAGPRAIRHRPLFDEPCADERFLMLSMRQAVTPRLRAISFWLR